MAPQTRSAKTSPARTTRNSVYGRPPLLPPKPLKSSTNTVPAQTAQAHEQGTHGNATSAGGTKGTPWLSCRDPYGIMTTVAVSETGKGVHVRWHYPEDDPEVDDADPVVDVEMGTTHDEERGVTPPVAAMGPGNVGRPPFLQTPMALQPYNAGSVILTPVKKPRPLQRSPERIGDKGVRCLYEKGGVLRDTNGIARIVLRHPVGSAANLSREQVERLEDEREERIIRFQVEKLLAEKKRLEEEESLSDSGYEEEMETDVSSSKRDLTREGTSDTILVPDDDSPGPAVSLEEMTIPSNVFRGPNGELLDRHGRQMLGREGTILIDSTHSLPMRLVREGSVLGSTDVDDHFSHELSHCVTKANGLRVRLGREGTELVN